MPLSTLRSGSSTLVKPTAATKVQAIASGNAKTNVALSPLIRPENGDARAKSMSRTCERYRRYELSPNRPKNRPKPPPREDSNAKAPVTSNKLGIPHETTEG